MGLLVGAENERAFGQLNFRCKLGLKPMHAQRATFCFGSSLSCLTLLPHRNPSAPITRPCHAALFSLLYCSVAWASASPPPLRRPSPSPYPRHSPPVLSRVTKISIIALAPQARQVVARLATCAMAAVVVGRLAGQDRAMMPGRNSRMTINAAFVAPLKPPGTCLPSLPPVIVRCTPTTKCARRSWSPSRT